MSSSPFDLPYDLDIAWCPGCGNFAIIKILKQALENAGIEPRKLVLVSGIGQAAKMPQYLQCHYFNGLHGRSLPVATAVKACNPALCVIAESGDGCTYGEGGNHFLHTIRRNPDIVNLVHNNMIYGLTKGQGAPTTMQGMKTSIQLKGYALEPFNPLAAALAMGAGFVARVSSGDAAQATTVIEQALDYPGYALVDIFHPCISFNKLNTFRWYREHTDSLEDHDETDLESAMTRAMQTEPYLLGVFYRQTKPTFRERSHAYDTDDSPLCRRDVDPAKLADLLGNYRIPTG